MVCALLPFAIALASGLGLAAFKLYGVTAAIAVGVAAFFFCLGLKRSSDFS